LLTPRSCGVSFGQNAFAAWFSLSAAPLAGRT
jgi:hypothetical protein